MTLSVTKDIDGNICDTLLPDPTPRPLASFKPRSPFWLERNSRSERTCFILDSIFMLNELKDVSKKLDSLQVQV
ncbi:hypothetical protein JHK86_036888 [Glycine max]|nr:hypothetical protein JHK86_036888 [Glycine max]